jgi:choline dehydrogenase-like flavoprotein
LCDVFRPGSALSAALRASRDVVDVAGRHDAIVVGAGAAGGLAAWALAEAGLRVLVLDAGQVRTPIRRLTRRLARGLTRRIFGEAALTAIDRRRHAIQIQCYAWPSAPEAFVDDLDCPYVTPPNKLFVWLRARQLGGRWVIPAHGRQCYRLGPTDLAPADGRSPPWPLRAGELDPWYAAVERKLALSGNRDKLPWLPDGEISITRTPTPFESAAQRAIRKRWPGAHPVLARTAPPFDSLESAARTGRLCIRVGVVARKIEVTASGHVRGVVWIDCKSRREERASAPLVFLCASALESTRLLLLSGSSANPQGLGSASGVIGRFLMDHVRVRAEGTGSPAMAEHAPGQGGNLYLPRFDARDLPSPAPGRGFGVQIAETATNAGKTVTMASFAEMLPRAENRVTLDPIQKDAWGIPVLRIDCGHSPAELTQAREQASALREIANALGLTLSHIDAEAAAPGSANHECGTARMGSDPSNSVIDPHNECWEARGLYLTDAACFPSQGTQNPILTILALTARACDHAIRS